MKGLFLDLFQNTLRIEQNNVVLIMNEYQMLTGIDHIKFIAY